MGVLRPHTHLGAAESAGVADESAGGVEDSVVGAADESVVADESPAGVSDVLPSPPQPTRTIPPTLNNASVLAKTIFRSSLASAVFLGLLRS